MPRKSWQGRRKLARSKRRKERRSPASAVIQQQTSTPTPQVTAVPRVSIPPAGVSTPRVAQHPYVVGELKRIGILAGIILVILVVLAAVLS